MTFRSSAPTSRIRRATLRQIAAGAALLYALLVVATNLNYLTTGVAALFYVAAAIAAPVTVFLGENLARRGDPRGDAVAQMSLGVIFGLWALPASSGLIALLAIIAGVRGVQTSSHRGIAISSLLVGIVFGAILLAVSFRTV